MSQKLVVSVDASQDGPKLVTVQDVLTHVLELFQLVTESDPENEGKIVWQLVSASMNSPFTVTAEAIPVIPFVGFEQVAERQVSAFANNYRQLQQGQIPTAWGAVETRKTLTRLLARNKELISKTVLRLPDMPGVSSIEITPQVAKAFEIGEALSAAPPSRTKDQYGSVEGQLLQVRSHYGQPAIQIIERKTKQEVWCVVPEEFQHEISESTTVEDVWRGSRVVVRGKISYGSDGKVSRVAATSVRRVVPVVVSEEAIVDKEFTGGLSVSEYLEKFRDGNLG